ncbi:MAG TPA: hypothetical protein VGE21_08290 [Flavobacteriales bacterium]
MSRTFRPVLPVIALTGWISASAQVQDSIRHDALPIGKLEPIGTKKERRIYGKDLAASHWGAGSSRHHLQLDVTGLYDANSLRNDLVMGLYLGKELDRAVRERTQDALKGTNRAGAIFSADLSYSWGDSLFGKAGWQPRVAVGYRAFYGARFTDAVYDLSFFGNAAYEDRIAELGPGAFEGINYQTVGFGIAFNAEAFIQLNLVNGGTLNAGNIRKADLYTAPDGQYLDLDLDGDYWRSDTAVRGFDASNGIGASLSGAWAHTFPGNLRKTLVIGVQDLGFIHWNTGSLAVSRDEPIRFEGIAVEDVLDIDGPLVQTENLQDSLGLGYKRQSFTRVLPALLEARFQWWNAAAPVYEVKVDMRYLAGYLPHIEAARYFRLSQCILPEVRVGYGGFGGSRVGIGARFRLGNAIQMRLSTPNVVGTLARTGQGQGVLLGLEARW